MTEFHKNMPMEQYQARTDLISKSMLSKFADCPARYKHQYLDGNPQETTDSLRLGTAVHTLALEPELWRANYYILPATYFDDKGVEKPWRHDKRMKIVQEHIAAAGNKTILKADEYEQAEKMAESLTRNSFAFSLLKTEGYVEASILWDRFKCRPDFLANAGYVCDLKIANSVKPSHFMKDADNFKYWLSTGLTARGYEAHYGKEIDEYIFITIEQEAPYFVECYCSRKPMDDLDGRSYMDYGLQQLDKLMQRYDQCVAINSWPQYQEEIGVMKLPKWKLNQMENDDV